MFRSLKAALFLSGVMLACPAQAASYLTYTFETVGDGSFTNTRTYPLTVTPLYNLIFRFSFSTDTVQTFPQGQSVLVAYSNGSAVLSASQTALSLTASNNPQNITPNFSLFLGASVYQNLGGILSAGSFGVDTDNSSVSYRDGSGSGNTQYAGKVIAVSATQSDRAPEETGLRIIPGVPEPSTWAMMLVGFGMAGYAIRRRKVAYSHLTV